MPSVVVVNTPKVVIQDGYGNPISLTYNSGDGTNRLLVSGSITTVSGGYGGQVEGLAADGVTPSGNPVYIAGTDGSNVQAILTDSTGRIVVAPSGASTQTNGFSDGRIVYSSTTITSVRETAYTEQSSNAQRSVSSSSASDTSAGTGARTIRITYYTSAFVGPNTTDVTLNGTSAVNTSFSDICYIEKIEVLTVGSGLVNAGVISLFASTGGAGGTVWSIATSSNKTFGAHHYVATTKTCYVTGLLVGIKGADTTGGFLRAQDLNISNTADKQITDTVRAPDSGQSFRSYGTPIAVAAGFRITGMIAPDSTSSRTYYLSFDFYEE